MFHERYFGYVFENQKLLSLLFKFSEVISLCGPEELAFRACARPIPDASDFASNKKPARGGLGISRNSISPNYLRLADTRKRRTATNVSHHSFRVHGFITYPAFSEETLLDDLHAFHSCVRQLHGKGRQDDRN